MDSSFASSLLNVGAAALASIAIALFEPPKNVRAVLFILVLLTAMANFHFQRKTTASLNQRIETLQVNRWPPLTDDEGERFMAELKKTPPPRKSMNVLCSLAGCSDLATSIRHWGGKAGWKIGVQTNIFESPESPLEYWYFDASDTVLVDALEAATSQRLKAARRHFESANVGQINLVIGFRP